MTEIQPVPAATVVVVRETMNKTDLEVLLLRRNSKLIFHGGHWVFPGGRVDAADFDAAEDNLEYRAALRAAVRETKEEAGIDIDIDRLIHTAHWTTPPKLPRRFCTWFFLCPLAEPASVIVDNDEILEHRWITPREALAEAEAETWVLPRPTMVTLQDIEQHRNLEELLVDTNRREIRVFPEGSSYYRPREMGC
ncbi:MAG: NUDIX hydrolase [Gammaproteobacteria bacterium]|nr:NUDIX hydrolase [Gammaproteobacteria bacterium]